MKILRTVTVALALLVPTLAFAGDGGGCPCCPHCPHCPLCPHAK
jgi:hypothetical protein